MDVQVQARSKALAEGDGCRLGPLAPEAHIELGFEGRMTLQVKPGRDPFCQRRLRMLA